MEPRRKARPRTYTTEAWLHLAIDELMPMVASVIEEAPAWVVARCAEPSNIQVGVGYDNEDPSRTIAGVTLDPAACVDRKTHTILFSPDLLGHNKHSNAIIVLAVVLHELIHTWVYEKLPHGRTFQEVAKRCGFVAPYPLVLRETITPRLSRRLGAVARKIGKCPWRTLK